MARVPVKVEQRIKDGIKKYAVILKQARDRDINESDTVLIVSDMLADIFGYDKYSEITSEYAIRNTYCDLAIKQDGKVVYLIECKAIGTNLKGDHLRQAVEYSSTLGIDWAILTNGQIWKVYKIVFEKPIRVEEIFTLDFIGASVRDLEFISKTFVLTREAISKSFIEMLHEQSKLVNKHLIAAVISSDDCLGLVRRKLRGLSSSVQVDVDLIRSVLFDEVIKRDVLDSDEMKAAVSRLKKLDKKIAARSAKQQPTATPGETLQIVETASPELDSPEQETNTPDRN